MVDKITRKPLDSVFCEVTTGTKAAYTDSTGEFDLCNPFGGCMPCRDIKIRFSKKDYKTMEVKNPINEVIYLEQ